MPVIVHEGDGAPLAEAGSMSRAFALPHWFVDAAAAIWESGRNGWKNYYL
jgi:hypothetical protein